MNHVTPNPNFVPSAEQQALDRDARERKPKDNFRPTREDDRVPMTNVVELGDAMKPAVAVLARLQERRQAFYDDIRDKLRTAVQHMTCPEHPEVRREIDFDKTCVMTQEADELSVVYQDCPTCTAISKADEQRRYWSRRGVPGRVLEATFANFDVNQTGPEQQATAILRVRGWLAKRTGFLVLIGTTGTGKGHLAAACLKANGSGLWIEHPNMLAALRTSYTTHTTEEVVGKWQDAEMFVLDEFGLSAGGADEEPMLYQVLADRYENRRPTIITTNIDQDQLRTKLGFRLLDRIRAELTQVPMCWPSFRNTKIES